MVWFPVVAWWLSQVVVALAMVADVAAFQFVERTRILLCLSLAGVLLSVHFFLLGHSLPGYLVLVSVARKLAAVWWPKAAWLWLFLVIATACAILTYDGWLSIVAYLAAVLVTVATFRETDRELRRWQMAGTTAWIVHNSIAGSPMAVLMEVGCLASNIAGYRRYYAASADPRGRRKPHRTPTA